MDLLDYYKQNTIEKVFENNGWFDKVAFTMSKFPPLRAKNGTLWYHDEKAYIKNGPLWNEIPVDKKQLQVFIEKVKSLVDGRAWVGRTFDLSNKGQYVYHIEDGNIIISQRS